MLKLEENISTENDSVHLPRLNSTQLILEREPDPPMLLHLAKEEKQPVFTLASGLG